MARRTKQPGRPHTNKIPVLTRLDPLLFEEIKAEAAATKRHISDVIGERLSRGSLLDEIRAIIREELNR